MGKRATWQPLLLDDFGRFNGHGLAGLNAKDILAQKLESWDASQDGDGYDLWVTPGGWLVWVIRGSRILSAENGRVNLIVEAEQDMGRPVDPFLWSAFLPDLEP